MNLKGATCELRNTLRECQVSGVVVLSDMLLADLTNAPDAHRSLTQAAFAVMYPAAVAVGERLGFLANEERAKVLTQILWQEAYNAALALMKRSVREAKTA